MTHAEYMRAYYARRKAAGVCYQCSKPIGPISTILCEERRIKANKRPSRAIFKATARNKAYMKAYLSEYRKSKRGKKIIQLSRFNQKANKRLHRTPAIPSTDLLAKLAAFDGCAYCETSLDDSFHWDHIVPIARGGKHEIDNVVPVCPACNLKKNAKPLNVFLSEREAA